MAKLLVATRSPFVDAANARLTEVAEEGGLEVEVIKGMDINEIPEDKFKDVVVLGIRSDKPTQETISKMPYLKGIIRGGAGCNQLDDFMDYLNERHIAAMPTAGMNSVSVAELSIAMIVALNRGLSAYDATTKMGDFQKGKIKGNEIMEKTIGLHGFGHIGGLVADRLRPWGVDIHCYDPFVSARKAEDKGVTMVGTIEELYDGADIVSLHIPETKDTNGIVDRRLLSLMAEDGMVINCARAPLINFDDLEAIMNERENFKYGADVHPGGDKPCLDENDNVVARRFADFGHRALLLPHTAANTYEANFRTAENLGELAVMLVNKGDTSAAINKGFIPYEMRDYVRLAQMLGAFNSHLVEGQPHEVRVICYGELEELQEPLAQNVLKGMFGIPDQRPAEAGQMAKQNEIVLDVREPKKEQDYANSITIDYFTENGKPQTSTIRGTVLAGTLKLNRIEEFEGIDYSVKDGIVVMFQYDDKEGMADQIYEFFTNAGYTKKGGRWTESADDKRAINMFRAIKKEGVPLRDGFKTPYEEVQALVRTIQEEVPGVYKTAAVEFG